MKPDTKLSYVPAPILRILRLLLFGAGIVSIFWFFFSFIGVLIGILLFVFSRDPRWRAHGFMLSLSAGISEFVSHTATAVAPLHLGMRTGPSILTGYLLLFLLLTLMTRRVRQTRENSTDGGTTIAERLSARITAVLEFGASIWRRARIPLTIAMTVIPVGLWASVSIHLGVLFDNRPRMLWVHTPSTAVPGEKFAVTIQAWDAYERLSAMYRGTVGFGVESYKPDGRVFDETTVAQLPDFYTFTGRRRGSGIAYRIRDERDNGRHRFTARIDTPGIHYLVIHDSLTRNSYYSNPIEVLGWIDLATEPLGGGDSADGAVRTGDSADGAGGSGAVGQGESERIYWGDIHSHSDLSDGTGTAPQSYFFAREVACLDFYALTDHGEIMSLSFRAFDKLEKATNEAYDPGSFVTFHGVEWTQVKTGHYTCIFSGDRLIKEPRLSYLTVPTTEGLWKALDAFTERADCRALALPHHTTQNSYIQDWSYINPKYVKLAEVCSVHGEFLFEQRHPLNYVGAIDPPPEYVPGSSIADALRMGKRLILYAASDEHDGHPGHSLSHTAARVGHQRPMTRWRCRIGHPYPGGLTAVHARELTRETIFSALQLGRIFACSDHGRPLLSFTINGVPVGSGAPNSSGEPESNEEPGRFVQVAEPTSPRLIEIFLAQDGSPAAARDTSAVAAVMSRASSSGEKYWNPDWKADIEIIKNGELLTTIPVDRPVSRIEYLDRAPVRGAAYGVQECFHQEGKITINRYSDNPVNPASLHTAGADFYLIRVVGANGRSAYAGPIWVKAGF
jgi:hypothetical protein